MRDAMRMQYKETSDEAQREQARRWLKDNDREWLEDEDYETNLPLGAWRFRYLMASGEDKAEARAWLAENDAAWLADNEK